MGVGVGLGALWILSLRSLPVPLLLLVLLDDNRHAQRGQARLLVCQTAEVVGVTAGVHHIRSLHRRRSLSTSILVLIPFPFFSCSWWSYSFSSSSTNGPSLTTTRPFATAPGLPERAEGCSAPVSISLMERAELEDGLLHCARVRVGTSTAIDVIRAGGGGSGVGGVRLGVGGV